ncbi:MAG: alpha-galactosidase [Victivallaceae bacterium]|nr:alpha-galactosidase [Victivallaceae bacterium]
MFFEDVSLYSRFELGDMTALYFKAGKRLMFTLIPAGSEAKIPDHRRNINDSIGFRSNYRTLKNSSVVVPKDSAIQFQLLSDPWSYRGLMRNGGTVGGLELLRQVAADGVITTVFGDRRGFEAEQTLRWRAGERYIVINTTVSNHSAQTVELGMLESFTLNMLSPFHADHAPDALKLHRYCSQWASEGRHVENAVEDLELGIPWNGDFPHGFRFGQQSSMVVREYFPTVGLEDTVSGVTWAIQLATVSPWQMTVARNGDFLSLGGGKPDFEFANWRHTLRPGESCAGMPAVVTCTDGGMQQALNRLTRYPVEHAVAHPAAESKLPVIFNEFCSTWGEPSEEKLLPVLERISGLGFGYFVIDGGWSRDPATRLPGIGDWNPDEKIYPSGLDSLLAKIRAGGMIPGIWFEFENIASTSELFSLHPDWLVKWEGRLVHPSDTDRYFLDFRKAEVQKYLDEKVIAFLRKHRIGYMKVDYNAAFSRADSANGSYADGVQEVLESVRAFYLKLRQELPELVLEICSSGGHRLTAEWLRIGDMASFSDCHEGLPVPVIAAQTALQIPLTANQVWATLRRGEEEK